MSQKVQNADLSLAASFAKRSEECAADPDLHSPTVAIAIAGVTKEFALGSTGGGSWLTKLTQGTSEAEKQTARVHRAVDQISFDVLRGETVGLLGVNGAGKSTILQLITGTLTPTEGHVSVNGRISALLELGAGFNPDWSGRQNAEFHSLIHGIPKADLSRTIAEIEAFADIGHFFDQPMKMYSSGMFARHAFATAIAAEPDILIVDEALAVGDTRFQNKCFAHFRRLQDLGKTILFVSHDAAMVTQFCTRGVVIDRGKIHFDGPVEAAVGAYRKLLYGSSDEPIKLAPRRAQTSDCSLSEADLDDLTQLFAWPPDRDALSKRGYYNPYAASAGSVVGHVIDVLVVDRNNVPLLGPISSGTRFRIAVQIVSEQEIFRPQVGLIVKTRENTMVYGVTSIMLGSETSTLKAGEPIVAVFEIDNPLAQGDYFVDIGLSDLFRDEFVNIEWRVSLLHLTVTSQSDHYGFVDLAASFLSTRPIKTS